MILNPMLILESEQQERFERILQTIDFSICTNDYDVAKLMFLRMDAVIKILRDELKDRKDAISNDGSELSEKSSSANEGATSNEDRREGSEVDTWIE